MANPRMKAQHFETGDNHDRVEWLNPISMSKLQHAVKGKKPTVVLSDGTKYSIKYGIKWKSVLTDDYEVVWLQRADGTFGSCGYISVKRILNFDFEKGE